MLARVPHLATWDDLALLPGEVRAEVIAGAVETMPSPTVNHQIFIGGVQADLVPPFMRGGGNGPGGWWIVPDVDVELGPHDVVRPDISGWRKERMAERPVRPVRTAPDWVCEVLSPSNELRDRTVKMELYRRYGVPFVWIVDVRIQYIEAFRLVGDFYSRLGAFSKETEARLPPFDAVPLDVAGLFELLGPPEVPQDPEPAERSQ